MDEIRISSEMSERINVLRFPLFILVAISHITLTFGNMSTIQIEKGYSEPAWISAIKQIFGYLESCAVPVFAFFSAYLQFSRKHSYTDLLKKRARTLFVPYILWNFIGLLVIVGINCVPTLKAALNSDLNNISSYGVIDYLDIFWGRIKRGGTPIIPPLWYVRDLIVLILISPIIEFLCKKIPVSVLVCTGLAFMLYNMAFPRILFFYILGWYAVNYKINFFAVVDKIAWIDLCIMCIAIVLFRFFVSENYGGSLARCSSFLLMLKLSKNIIESNKREIFLSLGKYSFFVYCIHGLFIYQTVNRLGIYALNKYHFYGVEYLIEYIFAAIIVVIISLLLAILCKKLLPALYKILTGSR